MKRNRIISLFLLMCIFCLILTAVSPVYAIEGTSYTYTISADLVQNLRTMDAYLPAGTYLTEIGLRNPEDMYLHGNKLYIADTGNRRIVVYSLDTGEIKTFGEGDLRKPTGIAVAEDGTVYVADYGAEQVVVFSNNWTVAKSLSRPTEPYYGTSPYKPKKLDLDSYGNLFVISEGTHEGIIQFDKNGNFNGFFGANKTDGLSAVEWFQKIFYTEEQKARMTFRTPPNIVSIDVSANDMVFSVTQNDRMNAIKKLNMAGINVFTEDEFIGWDQFVDVAVRADGGFYAVANTGLIAEYNENGDFLIFFGGEAKKTDRNGLTAVVSAIEVDDTRSILISWTTLRMITFQCLLV